MNSSQYTILQEVHCKVLCTYCWPQRHIGTVSYFQWIFKIHQSKLLPIWKYARLPANTPQRNNEVVEVGYDKEESPSYPSKSVAITNPWHQCNMTMSQHQESWTAQLKALIQKHGDVILLGSWSSQDGDFDIQWQQGHSLVWVVCKFMYVLSLHILIYQYVYDVYFPATLLSKYTGTWYLTFYK